MALQEIYSIAQAAEYFGVDPQTVYRWIKTETLPATKVAGSWRIHRTDLHTLVEPVRGAPGNGDLTDAEFREAALSLLRMISHGDTEPMGLEAVVVALRDIAEAIREQA